MAIASILLMVKDPLSDNFVKCMEHLQRHTSSYELLMVNNEWKDFNPARDWNRLIKIASFDYLVFLNDDCFVGPNWLSILIKTAESDPTIGIVSGIPEQTEAFPGTPFLVKRKVFEKIGLLDESIGYWFWDNDLLDRARMAGFIIESVKTGTIHSGGGTGGSLSLRTANARAAVRYFRKNKKFLPLFYWVPRIMFLPLRWFRAS